MVFVRAFASVVNCRWSSADSVSQRSLRESYFWEGFQRHGIVGVKADLCKQHCCSISCKCSGVRNTLTRSWINILARGFKTLVLMTNVNLKPYSARQISIEIRANDCSLIFVYTSCKCIF